MGRRPKEWGRGCKKRLWAIGLTGILLFLSGGLLRGLCSIALNDQWQAREYADVAALVLVFSELALVLVWLGAGVVLVCAVKVLWIKD
ncbi:MAG: hypothetical protein ACI8PQ_002170 [Planctomycetota bacterium]|jgi:hypothetical protein